MFPFSRFYKKFSDSSQSTYSDPPKRTIRSYQFKFTFLSANGMIRKVGTFGVPYLKPFENRVPTIWFSGSVIANFIMIFKEMFRFSSGDSQLIVSI